MPSFSKYYQFSKVNVSIYPFIKSALKLSSYFTSLALFSIFIVLAIRWVCHYDFHFLLTTDVEHFLYVYWSFECSFFCGGHSSLFPIFKIRLFFLIDRSYWGQNELSQPAHPPSFLFATLIISGAGQPRGAGAR